jgi:hypothetical protein
MDSVGLTSAKSTTTRQATLHSTGSAEQLLDPVGLINLLTGLVTIVMRVRERTPFQIAIVCVNQQSASV